MFPFQPVQPLHVSRVSFLNLDTDITMTKSRNDITKPSSTLPHFLPLPSAPLYPALPSSSLSPTLPETRGWHWDIRCRVDPGGFHHKEGSHGVNWDVFVWGYNFFFEILDLGRHGWIDSWTD